MSKITLILGGARSGKSFYALTLAKKYKKVAFIATCQGLDQEMRLRIKLHKESRPKHWETFEEAKDLVKLVEKMDNRFDCIVIDCLTLLVSNLLLAKKSQEQIIDQVQELLLILKKNKSRVIMVSNEVGLGLVPVNRLGREFRDIAGKINQIIASKAGEVLFMAVGLPMKLKGK